MQPTTPPSTSAQHSSAPFCLVSSNAIAPMPQCPNAPMPQCPNAPMPQSQCPSPIAQFHLSIRSFCAPRTYIYHLTINSIYSSLHIHSSSRYYHYCKAVIFIQTLANQLPVSAFSIVAACRQSHFSLSLPLLRDTKTRSHNSKLAFVFVYLPRFPYKSKHCQTVLWQSTLEITFLRSVCLLVARNEEQSFRKKNEKRNLKNIEEA